MQSKNSKFLENTDVIHSSRIKENYVNCLHIIYIAIVIIFVTTIFPKIIIITIIVLRTGLGWRTVV